MSKPEGSNYQTIISVGIDIGTTTTQLVVSRLTVKNTAPGSSVPRMEITDKEVLYRSAIHITPLKDNHHSIDADRVAQIVNQEYREAGLSPNEIDTGAVIITGETAKKENAKKIVESMAGLAGDFVVATAGVNLESILAGKGSGAAAFSREKHCVVANVDIGGGTSNIGIFKNGRVIDTACLNIGGHLVEMERHGDRITYITEPAKAVLRECGLLWQVGDKPDMQELTAVTKVMAKGILEALTTNELSEVTRELLMTPPLKLTYKIDKIMFSGGVADFVYGGYRPIAPVQVSQYGDIGPLLGWAVREELEAVGIVPERSIETIRATVIGAGTHSVDLSGSTITVDESALPLRSVTVITPFMGSVPEKPDEVAALVKSAVLRVVSDGSAQHVAISMEGPPEVTFQAVQDLAEGVARGTAGFVGKDTPLILVVQKDCAKVLGQALKIILGQFSKVICIDQIKAEEGDYIDIGKPIMGGRVVPVVVKTLVFETPGLENS